jgi:hypothetical protein
MEMEMETETRTLSDDSCEVYERRRMALSVPSPWTDAFCKKNKLANMYIISTIAEIMGIRAEAEHGTKINCPNPDFTTYYKLISAVLKSPSTDKFGALRLFLETKVGRPLKLVQWTGYRPDIRLLDTVDEAMGWLSQHLNL